ncbi:NAD(P)-binding protein [Rhizodiscina lignyota]|uniref:NAD(P)-binding protein n=1 Tax=Rhizodiscina lignyota TaxID=1504668 RepID=A0A9P4II31_9PEZI|nr:NAD(P)-binding protein [Rhizodiscina lignyota]
MRTVQIQQWGEIPKYTDADDLPVPSPDSNQIQLTVKATGLHQLVKGRASGVHYSAKTLPHTLGVDGVGTASDGKDYYFNTLIPGASTGSYSEKVNVWKSAAVPLPENADPIQIAGLVNPGMSSWMALTARTTNLPPNFTVVIMGATSMSGRVAAQFCRFYGAGKVIGVARNAKALAEIRGLDASIPLADDPAATDFSSLVEAGVDVVLDYIYGPALVALFKALKPTVDRPLQYVEIGSMAARETPLPADLLRSKDITMRGAGPGSWSMPQLGKQMPTLIANLCKVGEMPIKVMKLSEVAEGWKEKERVVFVP